MSKKPDRRTAAGPELRDFQRRTADKVYRRMFIDPDPARLFLLADEVGLGKTLVARSVIEKLLAARAAARSGPTVVVYLSANTDIARQNLIRLDPRPGTSLRSADRLSLLPFATGPHTAGDDRCQDSDTPESRAELELRALTPDTSLVMGHRAGTWRERAGILAALRRVRPAFDRGAEHEMTALFAHGLSQGDPPQRIQTESRTLAGKLSPAHAELFNKQLAAVEQNWCDTTGSGHTLLESLILCARIYSREQAQRQSTDDGDEGVRPPEEYLPIMLLLRTAMALTGVETLRPDLVVLDEFQRFDDVLAALEPSETAETSGAVADSAQFRGSIAQRLLGGSGPADPAAQSSGRDRPRVLLISATPYRMRRGQEDHEEFIGLYRMLVGGLGGAGPVKGEVAELQDLLRNLRAAFRTAPEQRTKTDGEHQLKDAAEQVAARLRRVMVRTERSIDPMSARMTATPEYDLPVVSAAALERFAEIAALAERLGHPDRSSLTDLIGYWKSAPFLLSFGGEHYQVTRHLRSLLTEADPDLQTSSAAVRQAAAASPALLDHRRIADYLPLEGPATPRATTGTVTHPALARLWADLFGTGDGGAGAHRLLWLPPARPSIRPSGPFEAAWQADLTKRLIFSHWGFVPDALAGLTSYECERRQRIDHHARLGQSTEGVAAAGYFDTTRTTGPLGFSGLEQDAAHLLLVQPLPWLAEITDPVPVSERLRIAGGHGEVPGPTEVLTGVAAAVDEELARRSEGTAGAATSGVVDGLPLNMRRVVEAAGLEDRDWHKPDITGDLTALAELWDRVDRIRTEAFGDGPPSQVPPITAGADLLALVGVGSPANIAYRVLTRAFPEAPRQTVVDAAAQVADAFRRLFNSPAGYRVLGAQPSMTLPGGESTYWARALEYCVHGDLQAVLTEYVEVLRRTIDLPADQSRAAIAVAQHIARVVRQSPTRVDPLYRQDLAETPVGGHRLHRHLRTDFAVRLTGTEAPAETPDEDDGTYDETGAEPGRARRRGREETLDAFNSPFRPFVLATTTIGQEGLDFHHYCHAIMHWNLATDPVDFEQREGRVHRYLGHAVRKNIARTALDAAAPQGPVGADWSKMIEHAIWVNQQQGGSELAPYWLFAPEGIDERLLSRVERHLPYGPFTAERAHQAEVLERVALYRTVLGQPRGEQVLDRLALSDPEQREILSRLRIDLRPEPGR